MKKVSKSSELLKSLIKNEIKNVLSTRRKHLNEYVTITDKVEGETSDVIIGTGDGKVVIGMKSKDDLNQIQYISFSKEDILQIIIALKKFI